MGKRGKLRKALASESFPKPIPARWAPMTVPIPRAPHGTAHWPQLASTAALRGVNPAASRIGALITTATPNPVTDSKNGATPTTTPAASATRSGSSLPRNRDTSSTAPPAESRLYSNNPPKSTYNTCAEVPRPPTKAPGTAPPRKPGQTKAPTTATPNEAAPARGAGQPRATSPTAPTTNGIAEIRTPTTSTMIECFLPNGRNGCKRGINDGGGGLLGEVGRAGEGVTAGEGPYASRVG